MDIQAEILEKSADVSSQFSAYWPNFIPDKLHKMLPKNVSKYCIYIYPVIFYSSLDIFVCGLFTADKAQYSLDHLNW